MGEVTYLAEEDAFVRVEGLHVRARVLRSPLIQELFDCGIVGKVVRGFPCAFMETVPRDDL